MSTANNEYPHQLGVQVREYVDRRLAGATEIQEFIHVWLAEVLEQCKKSFARPEPELLPKTPSAKRSRRRLRAEELQEEEVELPPRKRQSLAKKGKPQRKGNDDTETETEADDEEENVAPSPARATRRTRAAARSTASTRSTRTTRTRKKPNSGENKKAKSPVFSIKAETLKKAEEKTLETPKPATPLSSDDLRNKLTKKSSVSSLAETASTTPLTPKTPRTQLGSAKALTCSGSPRPAVGFLSVKERASQYEQKVLSSGGNTPTPKGPRINGMSRLGSSGSNAVRTPASGKNFTPVTPSTVQHKSSSKISLSSHHTSSSSAKRIIVKKNSVAPQSGTPVSRVKNRSSAAGKRASRRLSLKQTASTNRRSSIVRHTRQTQAQQEPTVSDNKQTSSERSSWVSVSSSNSPKGSSADAEVEAKEKTGDVPKLRGKLTLKKTKVLRPKATRSKRETRCEDDRAKSANSSSEAHESIEVNNSKENRRGTVTIQKTTTGDTQMDESDNHDHLEPAEGRRGTVTLKKNDIVDTGSGLVMESDGDRSDDRADNSAEPVVMSDKVTAGNRDSSSSEKSPSHDASDKSDVMEDCTEQDGKKRMSDSKRATRKSDSNRSNRGSRSSGQRPTSNRTRSSSDQARKASTEVEESEDKIEPAENLRPKRTTRADRNKTAASSLTSEDAEGSGFRQSSRLRSRTSRTSQSDNVANASDGAEDTEEGEDKVFAVPGAPAPKPSRASRSQRKRVMSESDEASETDTKRPCVDEKKSEGEESSSEFESARENESEEDKTTSDSDADVVDRTPSPKCPANKVVRPHPASFLNALNKDKNKLFNLNAAGMKSFLRSSPAKRPLTLKEQEVLRRKELEEKQRKENERMEKRKQQLQAQAEAKKRQREEHWRKVQNMRLQKQKREQEEKDRLLEKMEHKNKIPEQVLEVKRKEKQEKKQIRQQKHTEAEERRLQDEAERLRKLKEKEEEDRQHAELLQRKREYEEQERAKRIAEEKLRQEEHQREVEKKRKEEEMRQLLIQQENERQKLKQQAEREREQRLKAERMEKERQEQEIKGQKDLKEELMKLRELEKQRKLAEKLREEEMRQMEGRYKQLMSQQNMLHGMAFSNPLAEKASLNSTMTLERSPQSYQITPLKKVTKKQSEESYDISGLDSDASTDEEDAPKRKIPRWAQGSDLRVALVNQYYQKPVDSEALFGIIVLPDLNQMFVKKKPRFNKRTSSANWDSPLLKASIPRT